jgi:histidinol-phosphate aminotransferase
MTPASPTPGPESPGEPRPAPELAGIVPYRTPGVPAGVDLRLDGTERRSLPSAVADRLAAAAAEGWSRYPDPSVLEALLAQRHGVTPDRVLVTAGADEALDRVCRAVLAPRRGAVLAVPTFEMLPRYATLAGASVTEIEWPGGALPVDALAAAAGPATALVAVVSPNNPTGAIAATDALRRLAAAVPQAVLVVDQAYGEFADLDLTPAVSALPNGLSVRTCSKALGLAGARVGFAIGPAAVIHWMRAAGGPYSVARPSLAVAAARLADDADVADYVARVRTEREALFELLRGIGATPMPSQANFVLCRPPDAERFDAVLAAAGIATRAFPGRPGLEGFRRVTCPADDVAFERLRAALRSVGGQP